MIDYKIGDCLELLKDVPSESISTVITSPPYNLNKNYGLYKDKISFDEWELFIDNVTKEVYRILKPNGSYFLNLSVIPIGTDKEIFPLPFLGYKIIKENNFYLRNLIVWHFNNMQNCSKRLSGRYENILWCVKNLKDYIFNLDDVRVPYLSKNDKRVTGKGRNPTDVWFYNEVNNSVKKKLKLKHPCVYPLKMIERIILMSTNENDIVLDPFAGSGTTLIAAKNLNRQAIGFEIDEQYKQDFENRLEFSE